jgi:hypothetical protein
VRIWSWLGLAITLAVQPCRWSSPLRNSGPTVGVPANEVAVGVPGGAGGSADAEPADHSPTAVTTAATTALSLSVLVMRVTLPIADAIATGRQGRPAAFEADAARNC